MAHRLSDGTRVNQWGKTGSATGAGNKDADGNVKPNGKARPSHKVLTKNAFGVRVDVPIGTRKTGNKGAHETYRAKTRFGHAQDGSVKGAHDQNICAVANPGNVISLTVGGGAMGHASAHENEAPFPVELPAFFIKSFCPPNGIVADCFSGSGTTCDAAIQNGRRFVGCDIRQSQVDLCARRMATVTLALFAS